MGGLEEWGREMTLLTNYHSGQDLLCALDLVLDRDQRVHLQVKSIGLVSLETLDTLYAWAGAEVNRT